MENINANSAQKEIIIKSPLEEMMKSFFQDYAIVWYDPNVHNQENQQYITKLKQFCEVLTFTEWEKAAVYAKEAKTVCHVITSGTNGELLAKEISPCQNVRKLYVSCENKASHSTWAQNYPKVSCVETEIEVLIDKIEQNLLEWYKEASSLKFNLPAFAPIFNGNDKSEMNHLHRYLKVIPNFYNREQAKEDFVTLSRKIYSDQDNARLVKDFEKSYNKYNKEQILNWYTRDSFFYRVTNNCLRIATSDSIQYCRLPLKDIEQAIKDQYQTQSKNFSGLLYRGAYLSQEEWSSLKQNQDKEIEMHGFLSVSKDKDVGLNFMKPDPSKKVFITIIVPKGPNEEEQGFAEIENLSMFSFEKEILFNVRSRFTVLETQDDYEHSPKSKCRHLVLLYGAQGFRQFIAEKNPTQQVSIPNINHVSCTHCKIQSTEMPGKVLFVSLADGKSQAYYCKQCINYGASAFLCISTMDYIGKSYATKIQGCPLMINLSQEKEKQKEVIPFYGYKCRICELKKQKTYFMCTDCDIKWCESCFSMNDSKCKDHNIVLETSPFSFWCEKMSENELYHLKFQKSLIHQGDSFKQAQMYFESHQYNKAIEYYSLYIQENETKRKDVSLAACYNGIGLISKIQGEYTKALEYCCKALEIYKSFYGDNHPEIATCYNNIGLVYTDQGEHEKAVEYHQNSLMICKAVYGEDHRNTATSYNNIGLAYQVQGKSEKALKYCLKSLEIRKSVLGDNHPDTAASFSNIGGIYNYQGKYTKALDCFLKSLEIEKLVYGDNHPLIAITLNNIGSICLVQGEYREAIKYYLDSLKISKSKYGENHPAIADIYNNIGMVYTTQEEYEKALEYYLKALSIRKSMLGDNHPDTANTYGGIGVVYRHQGEDKKALKYYLKSLDIRKSAYGDNHPETASSLYNIGVVYTDQGKYKKAFECHLKSLQIRKSAYGEDHPETAASKKIIEEIHKFQLHEKKVLEDCLKVLEAKKSVYGENHLHTAHFCEKVGETYRSQEEYGKALEYYFKALEIRKSICGENHLDTAFSYNNIAVTYQIQKEYTKALDYFLKCLEIDKLIYGDNHPSLAISLNSIGFLYCDQNEYNKSLEYYSKALEIQKASLGEHHPGTIQTQNLIQSLLQNMQEQDL